MSYFISSDSVKLHYTDKGSGRPVVFISGYGAPGGSWKAQEEALTGAGYRAVVFDRRSHGRSENSIQGQHLCRHAADVHELITAIGLEKPVLVGQSMGASTVYAYLSIFGDGEISAAVCIDQTPRMLNGDGWELGMYNFNKDNMATFFDAPIPDGMYRDVSEGYLEPYMDVLSECASFDLVRTKPLLLEHAYADWRDVFRTVKVPVLFIAGDKSPYWSCKHAIWCAEATPDGHAVIIEECGHSVQIERAEECSAAILSFLKGVFYG